MRLIGSSVAFGAAGSDTWLRFNGCIAPGGVRWANDWDAPPGQRTDYDVFLYHSPIGNPSTDDLLESALADQGAGAPPLEIIQGSACPAPGRAFYLRIEHISGDPTGDVIEILDYGDGMEKFVQAQFSAATSIVDSRNAGVIAVGAVDPPGNGVARPIQLAGAHQRRAGQARRVGRFRFRQRDVRRSGSRAPSAAAPVVAGGAALLLGANLAVGARELGDLVRNMVIDRGPAGPDNFYGTGEFQLPPPPATAVSNQPSRYVPLASPTRILDTRPSGPIGPSNLVGTLWPGEILNVPITGSAGVPAGATAVAINLTLVGAARAGYGQALPTLAAPVGAFSSFNLDAAPQTRPNFAIVPLGQGGSISVYSNTGGNAIIDVLGYFTAAGGTATDGRFVGLDTSQRVLDTRRDGSHQPLTTDATVTFGLPAGVPPNEIDALVVNITGTGTIGEGFVQAYPGGNTGDIYKTSTLNLTAGSTAANTVIVPVTSTGVSLFADLGPGGSAHVIADVTGYITSSGAASSPTGLFVPVAPSRAYDSRIVGGAIQDGAHFDISANSAPGVSVPAGASGVVWNFTASGVDPLRLPEGLGRWHRRATDVCAELAERRHDSCQRRHHAARWRGAGDAQPDRREQRHQRTTHPRDRRRLRLLHVAPMTRLLTVCGSLQTVSMNRAALTVADAHARTFDDVTIDDFDRLAELPALNPDLIEEPGPHVDDWRRRSWSRRCGADRFTRVRRFTRRFAEERARLDRRLRRAVREAGCRAQRRNQRRPLRPTGARPDAHLAGRPRRRRPRDRRPAHQVRCRRDAHRRTDDHRHPRAAPRSLVGAPQLAPDERLALVTDDRRRGRRRHRDASRRSFDWSGLGEPAVDELAGDGDAGRDHRQVVAPVPVGLGDLGRIARDLTGLVVGTEPDHQAVRERPRLAALVAGVGHGHADFLEDLADDRRFERLTGLDEPGQAREHRHRPLHATGEERFLVRSRLATRDERDHRRRQSWERHQ